VTCINLAQDSVWLRTSWIC